MKKSIVIVVGPNASGKSEFGVRLAKKLNGEIISADSRQVYKGLDAGSGKITKKEMRGVPHHCLSIADLNSPTGGQFTALDFKNCAQKAILDILSRGKTPIIVGGTGFYIDAALDRVKLAGVPPDNALRSKLAKKTPLELLKMLKRLDPKRAKTVEQKNPRRLVRAIEIAKTLRGKTLGVDGKTPSVEERNVLWLGIKRPPEDLRRRIHKRLLKRMPAMIREIKKLHGDGLTWKRMHELGLEYRYVQLYVRGKLDYKLMTTQLQTAIWRYARRQMTWFKKNKDIQWISL